MVIAGSPEAVDRFTEWLRVGPPGARVEGIDTEDLSGDQPDEDGRPGRFRIL